MPKARRLWTNFSKGELSPRIKGRPDLASYTEGAEQITNFLLLRQGGLERRAGTLYRAEVKDSNRDTILIPFEFSVDDAFDIEVGHQYMRFYKNQQRIEVSGVPVEIVTPYTEADIRLIHFSQSADVLFLWHPLYPQRKLSRVSDTNWVLSTIVYHPPPSFEADTILRAPPGWVFVLVYAAATGDNVRCRAGDNSTDPYPDWPVFLAGDVGRQIISGAGRAIITSLIDQYQVFVDVLDSFDAAAITDGPGTLSSVGVNVTTTAAHGVTPGQFISCASGAQTGELQKVIAIPSATTMTTEYAFSVDQNGIDWKRHVPVQQNDWALRNAPQVTLDPDKKEPVGAQVTLVAGAAAFRSDDVGKFIVIYGGLIKITQFTSATQVKGEIITLLSGTTSTNPPAASAGTWTLEELSWDETRGFPRTGEFFQGRLAQAATAQQPTTFWLSASDDFENYAIGSKANDAIEYTIASKKINQIQWLADSVDLFLGTAGGEMRAVGERNGEPLGGDKIPLMEKVSSHGCAPVQPVVVSRRVIFIDRSLRRLLSLSYSFEQDSFDPIELTAAAEHITGSGLRLGPMALRQRLDPQIFMVRADGQLAVMTFFPAEKVMGFTRIVTDGSIEAVSVTPRTSGKSDQIGLIVNRTINGVTKRYVEYMEEESAEVGNRAWKSLQTDCAIIYNGPPTTTITGLDHLEAKTVDVVADGSYKGTAIVSAGAIALTEAASVVEVGLHYDSLVIPMSPAIEGSIIEGVPRSWDTLSVRLLDTIGGKVNGEWLQYAPSELDTKGLFTGDRQITGYGWDTTGQVTVAQTQPYPMMLLALYGELSVGDRA